MSKADNQQKLQTAFLLHQAGNLDRAANIYREIIDTDSHNFHAIHYLGVIEANSGNFQQAKSLMARSLLMQPQNVQFLENYATILLRSGDYETALQICQQGLQLSRASVSLLYVSAISFFRLKRLQDSITQFDKLLVI